MLGLNWRQRLYSYRGVILFRNWVASVRMRPEWTAVVAAGFSPPGIAKRSSAKLCGAIRSGCPLICMMGVKLESRFPL